MSSIFQSHVLLSASSAARPPAPQVNIQALMSCSNGGNAGVADAAAAITVPPHAPASGANPQQAGTVALPQAAPATAPPQSSATGGFDPQQLAMMQQMMALQQAGMMQPLMGWGGVGGMRGGGMAPGMPAPAPPQQQTQAPSAPTTAPPAPETEAPK